jgi:hypothetical protein
VYAPEQFRHIRLSLRGLGTYVAWFIAMISQAVLPDRFHLGLRLSPCLRALLPAFAHWVFTTQEAFPLALRSFSDSAAPLAQCRPFETTPNTTVLLLSGGHPYSPVLRPYYVPRLAFTDAEDRL